MKKLLNIILITLLTLTPVMAVDWGFSTDKEVSVTGDWEWSGPLTTGFWTKPTPQPVTATYDYKARSEDATESYYIEHEKSVGDAWKYGLSMQAGANEAGWTKSEFDVRTVNDPESSPAEGIAPDYNSYTQFEFHSDSHGEFTHTSLDVKGNGYTHVETRTDFESGWHQNNFIDVNNGW